ncbi:MauE/DoxX family redox-associated membrane protein [Paenibacillus eucommiae]|uniref:Membrane protein YphA (DoxX/SURF4 family) n=1 Tax=Paenibacillus eucommiae TaxID=1355755 RepID=A0ABS4J398_9BACL|nr:MauE/DoxX family redox-associated membrane protein [Paenibacillus eucommiae]MBP1993581.1 putative membrane protein YphA (DoxX/SURF4 family) [Paenibacillus eucommiae]
MVVASFFQIFLFIMFLLSGFLKLLDIKSFQSTLNQLNIIPKLVKLLSYMVPLLEILSAVLLLFETTRWIAECSLFCLCGAFVWTVYQSISKSKKIECNCFGNLGSETLGSITIVRIMLVVAMTLFLMVSGQNTDLYALSKTDWIGSISISIGIIVLFSLLQTFNSYKKILKSFDQKRDAKGVKP